jgi:hypothetical protein
VFVRDDSATMAAGEAQWLFNAMTGAGSHPPAFDGTEPEPQLPDHLWDRLGAVCPPHERRHAYVLLVQQTRQARTRWAQARRRNKLTVLITAAVPAVTLLRITEHAAHRATDTVTTAPVTQKAQAERDRDTARAAAVRAAVRWDNLAAALSLCLYELSDIEARAELLHAAAATGVDASTWQISEPDAYRSPFGLPGFPAADRLTVIFRQQDTAQADESPHRRRSIDAVVRLKRGTAGSRGATAERLDDRLASAVSSSRAGRSLAEDAGR